MPTVNMPVDCSLRSIRPFHVEVVAAFKSSGDLVIDCSAITACDIAAVQLLVSASKTAADSGRLLRLEGVPEVLSTTLARAGLALSPSADRILISEV
ncbi:anti-sigma-factor antagonist [Bosea sp. OK403]|jgi:anti-anti-sigma regulatory factor|uniref:STAS domain-containing protein n=1 Tax=Bosea sp. OK403 TaxID=1855286 RepID=UPI0008E2AD56|nr:STAS domain-containing protein [Bosea sp. OK403]SFI88459.1 anti-sigma-factor antagonist [Bosea sp. OK403]